MRNIIIIFVIALLISVSAFSQDYELDNVKSLDDIELSLKTWKEKEDYKKKELAKCDELRDKLTASKPKWNEKSIRKEWVIISKELKTRRSKLEKL